MSIPKSAISLFFLFKAFFFQVRLPVSLNNIDNIQYRNFCVYLGYKPTTAGRLITSLLQGHELIASQFQGRVMVSR